MARFELLRGVEFQNGDSSTSTLDVIVDLNSDETVDTSFGDFRIRKGYTRHVGRRHIGTFGRQSPIYAGGEGDAYYAHVSYFDGVWSYSGKSKRGMHHYHTAGSFFTALENFSAANNVPAVA